jgi:hypothetical protein
MYKYVIAYVLGKWCKYRASISVNSQVSLKFMVQRW